MGNNIGIITNTVAWFELQAERTKRRVKRDDLDTLTEIYTGPSAYEDLFAPVVGTMHPDYTLMRVISTSVKRLVAAMTEVTVNYQGKLANGSSYTSVPTINKYWMEGEVSYQTNGSWGQSFPITYGSGTVQWVTNEQPGILTYVRRYTGRCVELSYITNDVPTGEATSVGLANGFMGFQNVWDVMSGFTAGMKLSGGGSPIQQMACTDVRVEDRADGWYRITETYQSRMFPGKAGYQYPPPEVGATVSNKVINSPTSPGETPDQQQQNPADLAFWEKGNDPQGTAQGSANYYGFGLNSSVPGSVGADTYQSTGMDPAYGQSDGGSSDAAQIYPTISNDSSVPYSSDVGVTPSVYTG